MTKKLFVGNVPVGGGAPVSIQSMCNTKTDDVAATVAQIHRLERELDRDRRGPEWDIDFTCDGFEYSYEIHAETGAILNWEKEWDD